MIQQIKATGLSIREIARQTGLSPMCVWGHLAGNHKISPQSAKKYFQALGIRPEQESIVCNDGTLTNCGEDLIFYLEKCRNNPYWGLADVARVFDISRERVRQLYRKIYGEPYTCKYKEGLQKRKNEEISCQNDPRNKINLVPENKDAPRWKGTLAEHKFVQECKRRGLQIDFPCNAEIDCLVNGFYVDVKSAYTLMYTNKKQKVAYFRYSPTEKQFYKVEFFACYHPFEDCFFIIPNTLNKPKNFIFIAKEKSTYCNAKNKNWKYQNAFHLLNSDNDDLSNAQ